MKILSWNINGLRAIYKKKFLTWFEKIQADILCLQEIKAQLPDIPEQLHQLKNYYTYFTFAEKKGYSGLAVYARKKPIAFTNKLGYTKFDNEGRFLRLDYKNFILINIYLPQGDRSKKNIPYKIQAYKKLLVYLRKIKSKPIILIGDFNIAHKELDLARPKHNQNNTMFTLPERQQISKILDLGLIDTFRYLNPQTKKYTWWPYFYNARQRNIGWRLDYAFISRKLIKKVKNSSILEEIPGSDHCPIRLELKN